MNRSGLGSRAPADSTHSRTANNNSPLHLQGGGPSGALKKKPQKVQFDFKVWKGSTAETARAVRTKNLCALQLFSFSVIFYLNDHE